MSGGWIAVDLDGILAEYTGWKGPEHIGAPVPAMVARVRRWLEEGQKVRIFTARVWPISIPIEPTQDVKHLVPDPLPAILAPTHAAAIAVDAIRAWCLEHLGVVLTITCLKDYGMVCIYDDRCRQVLPNTGEIVGEEH